MVPLEPTNPDGVRVVVGDGLGVVVNQHHPSLLLLLPYQFQILQEGTTIFPTTLTVKSLLYHSLPIHHIEHQVSIWLSPCGVDVNGEDLRDCLQKFEEIGSILDVEGVAFELNKLLLT